jgi:hypothetical protein
VFTKDYGEGEPSLSLADQKVTYTEFGQAIVYEGIEDDFGVMNHVCERLQQAQREAMDHHCHVALGVPYVGTCPVCTRPPEPEPEPETFKERIWSLMKRTRLRLALWVGGDTVMDARDWDDEDHYND